VRARTALAALAGAVAGYALAGTRAADRERSIRERESALTEQRLARVGWMRSQLEGSIDRHPAGAHRHGVTARHPRVTT
jgi:hypothetical protein